MVAGAADVVGAASSEGKARDDRTGRGITSCVVARAAGVLSAGATVSSERSNCSVYVVRISGALVGVEMATDGAVIVSGENEKDGTSRDEIDRGGIEGNEVEGNGTSIELGANEKDGAARVGTESDGIEIGRIETAGIESEGVDIEAGEKEKDGVSRDGIDGLGMVSDVSEIAWLDISAAEALDPVAVTVIVVGPGHCIAGVTRRVVVTAGRAGTVRVMAIGVSGTRDAVALGDGVTHW